MENALQFTSYIEESKNNLWGCHFGVPQPIARVFLDNGHKRVFCRLNDAVEYQCGLLSNGDGQTVITINKKLQKKLGLKYGMSIAVALWPDETQYGLPISEEFAEVLRQDPEGSHLFHELTPGKQRTLIYFAGNIKNTEGRILRAFVILEHLKQNDGKVDFRQLNDMIKKNR